MTNPDFHLGLWRGMGGGDIEMTKREETARFARVSLWLTDRLTYCCKLPSSSSCRQCLLCCHFCQQLLLLVVLLPLLPTSFCLQLPKLVVLLPTTTTSSSATATTAYYCLQLLLLPLLPTVAATDILPTSNHLSFSLSTGAR